MINSAMKMQLMLLQ